MHHKCTGYHGLVRYQHAEASLDLKTSGDEKPIQLFSVVRIKLKWSQIFSFMDTRNESVNATQTSPAKGLEKDEVWFWIILGSTGVVAILGNSIVIFLITTRRRLQTTSNSFILSLSCSDLLISITTIPGAFICDRFGVQCSLVFWNFCNYFLCASVVNVCAMAGDRFCRVVFPLRYPVLMSPKRVTLTICIGWTLPIFLYLIPSLCITLISTTEAKDAERIFRVIQIFTFAVLPCAGLLLAFAKISRITLKHSKRHRVQVEQITSNSAIPQRNVRQSNRKSYSVLVLGAVIFFFVLCWSFTIYRGLCNSFSLCHVPLTMVYASRIFLVGNTAADPMVYAILKQDIRRELNLTFAFIKGNNLQVQELRTETRFAGQSLYY